MNAEKDTGGRRSPMIVVNGAKVGCPIFEHIPKLNQH